MRLLYICLGYCLAPIAFLREIWRAIGHIEHRPGLSGRLGFGEQLIPGALWVHAVSVGEVQAAGPLLRRLAADYPTRRLVLTTSTATGKRQAMSLYAQIAEVRYLPYDLPGCVRRFLDRVQPLAGIVLETELWPTLYAACGKRGIPLLIASARLSERSVRRYRKLAGLAAQVLGAPHVSVAAQSPEDARRFVSIGAAVERTTVSGNIKYDQTPPTKALERISERRADLGAGRRVWVAGSTHEGEEALMLQAHRLIQAKVPDALLVLAPRHPPRFEGVAKLLQAAGCPFQRWTDQTPVSSQTAILLLDTLGELVSYYALADVAFVGGSLVPIGGHNLLEPLLVHTPVLTGPSTTNDASTARLLVEAGAVRTITNAATLAEAVLDNLADDTVRLRAVTAGDAVLAANRGAVDRVCAALRVLVERCD